MLYERGFMLDCAVRLSIRLSHGLLSARLAMRRRLRQLVFLRRLVVQLLQLIYLLLLLLFRAARFRRLSRRSELKLGALSAAVLDRILTYTGEN